MSRARISQRSSPSPSIPCPNSEHAHISSLRVKRPPPSCPCQPSSVSPSPPSALRQQKSLSPAPYRHSSASPHPFSSTTPSPYPRFRVTIRRPHSPTNRGPTPHSKVAPSRPPGRHAGEGGVRRVLAGSRYGRADGMGWTEGNGVDVEEKERKREQREVGTCFQRTAASCRLDSSAGRFAFSQLLAPRRVWGLW